MLDYSILGGAVPEIILEEVGRRPLFWPQGGGVNCVRGVERHNERSCPGVGCWHCLTTNQSVLEPCAIIAFEFDRYHTHDWPKEVSPYRSINESLHT